MAEHVGDASLFLLPSGQRPCFVLILKDLPIEEDGSRREQVAATLSCNLLILSGGQGRS